METSAEIKDIAAALAKAQGVITNPKKGSENPHFKSQYADLAVGLNAVKQALSDNGIAIVQTTHMIGDLLLLDTRLIHISGQWIASHYPVCKFPVRHQEGGSAMTYARRYSLFAIVGIAGEGDDDDGNEANKNKIEVPPLPKAEPLLLDTDSSVEMRARMIDDINDLNSVATLRTWAASNKVTKDQLQPVDSKAVVQAFKEREKYLVERMKEHENV